MSPKPALSLLEEYRLGLCEVPIDRKVQRQGEGKEMDQRAGGKA